jgi:hypothetical protein
VTRYTPAPMERIFTRAAILAIAILALSQWSARCLTPEDALEVPAERPEHLAWVSAPAPVVEVAEAPRASLDVPDACRRLVVREVASMDRDRTVTRLVLGKDRGPAWLRDARARWRHQLELREMVRVVVATLGGDDLAAEMIWRKAIHESSGDEGNVHVMNRDLRANRLAASKGRKRATKRWRRATVAVHRMVAGSLRVVGEQDAWALGRGLYGQVTGLHMHRWSADAPPWSLCDPIIATVTVVWAMRAGLEECHGETLRDAYRRFSSGRCAVREDRLERRFDVLARGHVRGLSLGAFNPDAPAQLGDAWAEETTDREVLLAVLRDRVDAARRAP